MTPAILAAASPLANGLFDLVDKLFTTDEERANAKLKVLELEKSGELAQIAVNKAEAGHASIFVAGWRPFIGWVCGISFAWAFVVYPALSFFVVVFGLPVDLADVPALDLATMSTVLMGMLGLGALRTMEKAQGVSRDTMTAGGVSRSAK